MRIKRPPQPPPQPYQPPTTGRGVLNYAGAQQAEHLERLRRLRLAARDKENAKQKKHAKGSHAAALWADLDGALDDSSDYLTGRERRPRQQITYAPEDAAPLSSKKDPAETPVNRDFAAFKVSPPDTALENKRAA